jgi:diadenosine tetraphosphate (Ap4A) HIT family hydrolase
MNETMLKFGYPATLVAEYEHWVVLLRPAQPTLGSLVLAAKSEARAFSELEASAFAEMGSVVGAIEPALKAAVDYARINYLMLRMVDLNVPFPVIPRYEGTRSFGGVSVADAGWPKAPALGEAVELESAQVAELAGRLKRCWPSAQ